MKRTSISIAALTAGLVVLVGKPAAGRSDWECAAKPIEPCAKRHGRLSSQNGIGLKIWLIGTKRVVAVQNGFDNLPGFVRKYLQMTTPDHSYIFGDFEICPVESRFERLSIASREK